MSRHVHRCPGFPQAQNPRNPDSQRAKLRPDPESITGTAQPRPPRFHWKRKRWMPHARSSTKGLNRFCLEARLRQALVPLDSESLELMQTDHPLAPTRLRRPAQATPISASCQINTHRRVTDTLSNEAACFCVAIPIFPRGRGEASWKLITVLPFKATTNSPPLNRSDTLYH